MKLNILDQSPVFAGKTYQQAINETVALAKFADENNYHRFWFAEHHNTKSFASASPEILISSLGSVTGKIRLGSGGVLLTHYSPLKIAEQFKMLESLYPHRIDLGIGRAGGADARTNSRLNSAPKDVFGKVDELLTYLDAKNSESKIASPLIESAPEVWVLGTSVDSALYAARKGLRYSFANFISDDQCVQALAAYYQNFEPSVYLKEPYINLAVFCMAAGTEEKALELVKPVEVWAVNSMLYGKNENFPGEEEAKSHTFSFQEKMLVEFKRKSAYVGDVKTVAERLLETKKKLAVHEMTLVTICERPEDKLNSYKLLADYFYKQ
ncbi:MAG: LLM class flavin-dependent oxidoreductase [Ignavibacteria bacterium]|nr:LLM class flavin-dependent oxidoreductase [Ignavibacteria bacterium]